MAGPNSPYTALDADQVIKQVYDETTDRLRVETNATVTAGAMEVAIDSVDDSILVVGTEDGTKTGTQHVLKTNSTGVLQVQTVQVFTKPFDSITATYPSETQEVYQSRIGGIAGTVQETVTVNYTDSTKNFISNLART